MLAEHRLRHHLRLLRAAREIAVDANPMHLAIARHLVLADNRNVILALTGHHARGAANTGAQVDRHSPLVQALCLELIQRVRIQRTDHRRFLQVHRSGETRVLLVLAQVRLANDRASFHRAVVLRAGKLMRLADGRQFRADGDVGPVGGAQLVCVVAGTTANPAAHLAAIAKRQTDDVVGHAGLFPGRTGDFAAIELNRDQRHEQQVVLLVLDDQTKAFRRFRTEQNHIFPN